MDARLSEEILSTLDFEEDLQPLRNYRLLLGAKEVAAEKSKSKAAKKTAKPTGVAGRKKKKKGIVARVGNAGAPKIGAPDKSKGFIYIYIMTIIVITVIYGDSLILLLLGCLQRAKESAAVRKKASHRQRERQRAFLRQKALLSLRERRRATPVLQVLRVKTIVMLRKRKKMKMKERARS